MNGTSLNIPPVQTPVGMPPVPPLPKIRPTSDGPLTDDDLATIRSGAVGRRGVDKAARRARRSAIITLIIGLSALPFVALSPSLAGGIAVVGVCAVGVIELIGAGRMAKADARAPRMLGLNQLAFLAVITIYCVLQMQTYSPENLKAEAISPEFRQQLGQLQGMQEKIDGLIDQYAPMVTYGFYGLVIALSVLMQGGMALYYFSRGKTIQAYRRQTAGWVHRVLQAAR